MLSSGNKTANIYVKTVQFIETLYKGDIVDGCVRDIKQQRFITFPTSPLYIVRKTLLTMYNGEVKNFIMMKK